MKLPLISIGMVENGSHTRHSLHFLLCQRLTMRPPTRSGPQARPKSTYIPHSVFSSYISFGSITHAQREDYGERLWEGVGRADGVGAGKETWRCPRIDPGASWAVSGGFELVF